MRFVAFSILAFFVLWSFSVLAGGGAVLPEGYPSSVTLYLGVGTASSVVLTWNGADGAFEDGSSTWQGQAFFDGSTWDMTTWTLMDNATGASHGFTWDGSSSAWGFDESTDSFSGTGGVAAPGGGGTTEPTTSPTYGPTTDPAPEGTDTGSWWDWLVHQFDKVLVHLKNLFSWLWAQVLWLWDTFTIWFRKFVNDMWQSFIDYVKDRWKVDFEKDYQLHDRVESLYSMMGYVNSVLPIGKGFGVILTAWGACIVVRIARWIKSFVPTVSS
jgi:hypothetical protein